MLNKLKALALPILWQCAGAFAVTFCATLAASGLGSNEAQTLSLLETAAVAGLGAVIALVKSLIAAVISGGQTHNLVPAIRARRDR